MKKLLAVTAVILTAYLILTAVIARDYTAPAVKTEIYSESRGISAYTIGDCDGRIAVYVDGRLYMCTDTPTDSLPKADAQRIRKGIKIYSEKELKSLLEDYCS